MRRSPQPQFSTALAAFARSGQSQDQVDYAPGEIVATPERLPDRPYGCDTFSRPPLQEKATVRTAAQALQTSPVLHVSVGSKGEARSYTRGLSQREIVVLFSVHPTYEPFFGTRDLAQLPLDGVARIKIAKGSAARCAPVCK